MDEELQDSTNVCLLKIKKRNDNDFSRSAISIEENMYNPSHESSTKNKLEKQKINKSEENHSIENLKEDIDVEFRAQPPAVKKQIYMPLKNNTLNDSFALSLDLVNQNLSIDLNQDVQLKKKISDFYITFKLEINKEFFLDRKPSKKVQRGSVKQNKKSQSGFFNFNIKKEEIDRNSLNNSQKMMNTSIDKKHSRNLDASICNKFSFGLNQNDSSNNNSLKFFCSPGVEKPNKKSIFGEENIDDLRNNQVDTPILFNNDNIHGSHNNINNRRRCSMGHDRKIPQFIEENSNDSKFSLNIHEIEDVEGSSLEEENYLKPFNAQSLVVNNFSQQLQGPDPQLKTQDQQIIDNLEETKSLSQSNHAVLNIDNKDRNKQNNNIVEEEISNDSGNTEYKTFLRGRTDQMEYFKNIENQINNKPATIIKKNCSVLLPLKPYKKYQSNNILPNSENVKEMKLQPRMTHQLEPMGFRNFQTIASLHSEFNLNSNKKKYKLKQRQIIKKFDNSHISGQKHQLKFKSSSSIESGDSSQELKLDKQYCVICGDGFR